MTINSKELKISITQKVFNIDNNDTKIKSSVYPKPKLHDQSKKPINRSDKLR